MHVYLFLFSGFFYRFCRPKRQSEQVTLQGKHPHIVDLEPFGPAD